MLRSVRTPYVRIVQLTPHYCADSIELPLTKPPDELRNRAMPSLLGELFRAHLAERGDQLVLALTDGEDDDTLEAEFARAAPYLGDLRLLLHYEEPARGTLTSLEMKQITVRGGHLHLQARPLREAAPRARFYDFASGGQGFHTQLELMLALLPSEDPEQPWAPYAVSDVRDYADQALASLDEGKRFCLADTPDPLRWLGQLEALRVGGDHVIATRRALADKRAPLVTALVRRLRDDFPAPRTCATDDALAAAAEALAVHWPSDFTLLHKELGAGACTLRDVVSSDPMWRLFALDGGAENVVTHTRAARQRFGDAWPAEVVIIGGSDDGAWLCLDCRFDPSPLLCATPRNDRASELPELLERYNSLSSWLDWCAP